MTQTTNLFENVSPDSNSLGTIDFARGEAIKITITFDNNKFDLAHICNFISKLPMRGWNITFCGDDYTEANLLCDSEEMFRSTFVFVRCVTESDQYTSVITAKVDG